MLKRWLCIDLLGWVFIALVCYLTACSPQKRLNKLLAKHPDLKKDTVLVIRDTVITKHFNFDTLYNYQLQKDTVVIKKENVIVKLFHHNDTVFVNAQAKADTIYKEIKIPFKQVVVETDNKNKWVMYWFGAFCALLILAIVVIVFNRFKP